MIPNLPAVTAQFRTAITTVGTSFPLPRPSNKYAIQGIVIDNPSGNWIQLNSLPIERCPPFTLGWSRDLPNVTSLTATYINAPAGPVAPGAVLPAGVEVVFTTSSEPVGSSNGVTVNLTSDPGQPAIQSYSNAMNATEAGLTFSPIPGVAGQRINVTFLALNPDPTAGSDSTLRDWAVVIVTDGLGTEILRLSISPTAPGKELVLPNGARKGGVGQQLNLTAYTRNGSGTILIHVLFLYYYSVI